jgi:polysaccharide chain length determinant protein (PEP-CTERM system associated)
MDFDDYVDVVRRHKSWIAGPALAGVVFSVVVAFLWPDTYTSEATIRIVPPAVPERFVATNVNLQVGQRLAAFYQQVTSRDRLQNLIQTFNLYPRKRGRVPDEDLIEEMRRRIEMRPVTSVREPVEGRPMATAFRVSFSYENRYDAQKVVRSIVESLTTETLQRRTTESETTTRFLKEKVDAAKQKLDAIEAKVEQYKRAFAGKLPEQLESNLAQLRALDTQIASAMSSVNRATQEKLLLENQLRITQDQLQNLVAAASASSPLETTSKNERLVQLEREILNTETRLAGLREQYTNNHPDVRRTEALLAGLRQERDVLLKQEQQKAPAPARPAEPVVKSREQRQYEAEIERLRALIAAKDKEIEQFVAEQARLNKQQKIVQDRIDAIPLGEREYVQLTRDYAIARKEYEDLMLKSSQSAMATDLERQQQGEILEVLEPASLPQTPREPNRWMIVITGTMLGLICGVFLAGARELKDTSLKNLKDVKAYTGLPILGSVPLVESDLALQRKRRLAWVYWTTACLAGFILMLGSVYYYYTKGS